MEEGFIKVLSFIVFILLGHLLRRSALLSEESFRVISNIVLYITLPCLIIRSFSGQTITVGMLWIVLLGIACNMLLVLCGWWMDRKNGREAQAFSMLGVSGFNIGMFAIPFTYSFLSPEAFLAVCLFDAGNAIMCTGGTYAFVKVFLEPKRAVSPVEFCRSLFYSPSLPIYIIMVVLALMAVSIPGPVLVFTKIGADANAFLCMLMIGINIKLQMSAASLRTLTRIILVRYAAAFAMALGMYALLPFPQEMRQALALVAFAPMSAVSVIFIAQLRGDVFTAGTMNSLSIIISIALMSVFLLVI